MKVPHCNRAGLESSVSIQCFWFGQALNVLVIMSDATGVSEHVSEPAFQVAGINLALQKWLGFQTLKILWYTGIEHWQTLGPFDFNFDLSGKFLA